MLVHAPHTSSSSSPAGEAPALAGAGGPLWEGSPTGMAASTLALSPLTVQQNVPNIGDSQTAPRTSVVPAHEQGEGRSPGWRWGWMRKNIPQTHHELSHRQRHYGPLRTEYALTAGGHPPGSGPGQTPLVKNHKRRPTVLAAPETVYYTAAAPPTPTWGEPL